MSTSGVLVRAAAARFLLDLMQKSPCGNPTIDFSLLGRHLNTQIKITQFADDTCLYLKGTNSLENVVKVFEDFCRYAGLRLNIEKTEAIWLGKTNRFGKICNITLTHKPVKVLGIWISKNVEEMIKTNFEERISKLKKSS